MKSVIIILLIAIFALESTYAQNSSTFTDSRDSKTYKTVLIGKQVWMAENLAYLPEVSISLESSKKESYYYVYGYKGRDVNEAKATKNYQTYGVLYNWSAAKQSCPSGWHLPSVNEWKALIDYLGDDYTAGIKLKETGTTHWDSTKTEITNETGFSARPGGVLTKEGQFDSLKSFGFWWTSSSTKDLGIRVNMMGHNGWVMSSGDAKEKGISVRCIED